MVTNMPQTPAHITINPIGFARAPAWFGAGWRLFAQSPLNALIVFVIFMLLAVASSMVPVIGGLAFALASPVLTMGWLKGLSDLDRGKALQIETLFRYFQSPQMKPLLLLGLLSMGIGVAAALVIGVFLTGALAVSTSTDPAGAVMGGVSIIVTIVGLAVLALVFSALLFATPLVGFMQQPLMTALRLSARACLLNWGAIALWGMLGMLLSLACILTLGLGYLVVFPWLLSGFYLMYCEMFEPAVPDPALAEAAQSG